MKKILIIEDEEYLAEMYKMKFEREGYKVAVAEDGPEGIEAAEKEKPDLILLDLVLPGMDGYEVLRRLKGDKKTKSVKIYILSNLGQNGEVNHGFRDGADGYIIKANMTPAEVVREVEKVFNGKPAGVKKATVVVPDVKKAAGGKTGKPNGPKVLLFEDNEVLGEMYKLGLEKRGFAVELAKNGAWGFKLAREKKFDIIVMDIMMPAMNGQEAVKKLKRNAKTKNIPIIILSNSAQDAEIEEAKKLGATSYLLKSQITPAKLVREIKRILEVK